MSSSPFRSDSPASLISYNSVRDAEFDQNNEAHRPSQRRSRSRERHRVRWGSDQRFEYGEITTDEDTDAAGDGRYSPRDRSSSMDVTEAVRRARRPSGAVRGDRRAAEVVTPESSEKDLPHRRESVVQRIEDMGRGVMQRTRTLATRMGRPLTDWEEPEEEERHRRERNRLGSDDRRRLSGATIRGDDEGPSPHSSSEAHRLVRELTHDAQADHINAYRNRRASRPMPTRPGRRRFGDSPSPSPSQTPPQRGDGGILTQLIRLNSRLEEPTLPRVLRTQNAASPQSEPGTPQTPRSRRGSQDLGTLTPGFTPEAMTPRREKRRWYKKPPNTSTSTLVGVGGSGDLSSPASGAAFSAASKRRHQQGQKPDLRLEDEIRVTLQIAEIIARQRYIMHLCRALMKFGAPTHRLEEYMHMTAKVLGVDSQYLYVPGCMIISFDDATTRTAEVKLVRVAQGVDLGRLADTHNVYKNVVHDVIGIEEATHELDEIMASRPRFNKWIIVLVYGLATAMVGPFAFDARPIDLPIIFCNGALLGILQHVLAPRSVLYSNVFEVTAAVLTSFIARALGSIPIRTYPSGDRDYLFCFSAIAQSSIALILPGYTVLCSSLELQSHQIVAGSIRMVYAIIYSLFLGYGITVGTTIYGLIDRRATSQLTCPNTNAAWSGEYAQRFPFVAAFAACLLVVNQGKWRQAPIMVTIAEAGYVVNYFVTKRIGTANQVANTVGAFTLGTIGNLYSRLWHGHAATAILPGIFVLVPSGLAASGSLISGINSANEIRGNVSSSGNQGGTGINLSQDQQSVDLGYGMVQVAIGITVGLFIAALVVYPLGKRRSGLFSF